jgi:hypothetical protein
MRRPFRRLAACCSKPLLNPCVASRQICLNREVISFTFLSYYAIVFVLLGGCASQNHYVKPEGRKSASSSGAAQSAANGSSVVERSQAVVWQQLIAGSGRAGFVIESPNQETWTLQIHYIGDPKNYIDCGRVISKVKTAKGERNYDFPAAKAYQQYQLQQGSKLFLVDRRMNLDVRATLILEPLTQSRTRVKVDSQYTATRDQSVRGGGAAPFGVTDRVSFGLSDGAIFPNAATKCQATGKFESDVLAVARQ